MRDSRHGWFARTAVRLLVIGGWFVVPLSSHGQEGGSRGEGRVPEPRLQSLDGLWQIVRDSHDMGRIDKWYDPAAFPSDAARPIQVPGNINEAWPNPAPLWSKEASNLDWYLRTFTPEIAAAADLRTYLRFGAVSYLSEVWLNGIDLGTHEGGQDPFEFDVTRFLIPGRPNTLIVRVSSPRFGGINQHVVLAVQPQVRIIDGFARPDARAGVIRLDVTLENNTSAPAQVDVKASFGEYKPQQELGSQTAGVTVAPGRMVTTLILPVPHARLWSLDDPFLYAIGITTQWHGASTEAAGEDECSLRTGFRDFRIVNGYFCLNGKRIFLKSTHGGWYDPLVIQGTPRTMQYLSKILPQLKKAGFNTFRFIRSAPLPEQLDQADEFGFLIYSEHDTSWRTEDPAKFGISLNGVVRRGRNHPSLVMWGMLNETASLSVYERAKAWLPSLRAIDDTRLIMLSSGRWDKDFKTGSASNPGSSTWNVYLGGEDPIRPISTGDLPGQDVGAFRPGTGDAHVYQRYPTSWSFVTAFAHLAQDTKPFFLSEAGDGSSYDPIREGREMKQAGAPASAFAWGWIDPALAGLKRTWTTYDLYGVYPSIESMLVDSALSQSRQRALTFSMVRSNPKVIGFNLTSLNDCWGTGEGIMDNFYEFKPGELTVLQAGWAPLRWCLFVNPTNVYADRPLRVRVALANEDQLPVGDYPATLKISGAQGVVWKSDATVHVRGGGDSPFSYLVFDQDVTIPNLTEGAYVLEAELERRPNAAANAISFTVTSRQNSPDLSGAVTLLGTGRNVRDLLASRGAVLRDYVEGGQAGREVILVGDSFDGRAAAWRSLYARIARGAHAIFLSPEVFLGDGNAHAGLPKWLALGAKGTLVNEIEWLYHKDVVAKNGPAFYRMQTKLMTPEYYDGVLAESPFFDGIAVPDETDAVAIRCVTSSMKTPFHYRDGVMLGTYKYHAGHFTVNGLNILGNLGNPAADRLLLNLVSEAESDAASPQPLPAGFDAEMDSLGIKDGS